MQRFWSQDSMETKLDKVKNLHIDINNS